LTNRLNFYLLEYAQNHILRYKYKNLFIVIVMTMMVALLASTLFLSNAIKEQYSELIDTYPDIVLTNQKALHFATSDERIIDELLSIAGVRNAVGRVWGRYNFTQADTKFTIYGIDAFESYSDPLVQKVTQATELEPNKMLVSEGVQKILNKYYYKDYFNFVKSDGNLKKVFIQDVFSGGNVMQQKSLILMDKELARELFSYAPSELTDIAISVTNKSEVAFIANKMKMMYPNMLVETKDDLRLKYENIYNFRSGFFLALFVITLFTFFMIVYDKVSGLNSEQKKEIGILKAIGWRISDVLNAKLYEALLISTFSYGVGILLSFIYVYLFNGIYLRKIFLNNYTLMSDYSIHFHLDYEILALLFFLSVPFYVAATIIPSWRVATLDADEVMR